MAPRTIMIIRHAEKPPRDGSPPWGVRPAGSTDPNQLTVRGWQRAGALVPFFANARAGSLPVPQVLFAAATTAALPSLRSQATIEPLAAALGLGGSVVTRFPPGAERDAAAAILARDEATVLACWEHKRIADLIEAVTDGAVPAPRWRGKRFDLVLVLTRDVTGWRLAQVPQRLLAGDSADPLPFPLPGEADDDDDEE